MPKLLALPNLQNAIDKIILINGDLTKVNEDLSAEVSKRKRNKKLLEVQKALLDKSQEIADSADRKLNRFLLALT